MCLKNLERGLPPTRICPERPCVSFRSAKMSRSEDLPHPDGPRRGELRFDPRREIDGIYREWRSCPIKTLLWHWKESVPPTFFDTFSLVVLEDDNWSVRRRSTPTVGRWRYLDWWSTEPEWHSLEQIQLVDEGEEQSVVDVALDFCRHHVEDEFSFPRRSESNWQDWNLLLLHVVVVAKGKAFLSLRRQGKHDLLCKNKS